jgi:hypothetical protein
MPVLLDVSLYQVSQTLECVQHALLVCLRNCEAEHAIQSAEEFAGDGARGRVEQKHFEASAR